MKSARILYISAHPLISHAIRLYLINDSDLKSKLNISVVSMDDVMRLDVESVVADPPDLILFPIGFPGNPDLRLVDKHRTAGIKAPIILCPLQAIPNYDELVKSQVQGVISTSFSLKELKEAIYAVLEHKPEILKEQYARATLVTHQAA